MRQIAVLSVALVASLAWSYATWTDDSEEVSDDVVFVYKASENDLQRVAWNSKDLKVNVEKRNDAHGDYLWVETEEVKKKVKATGEKPPDHPPDESEGEDEHDHEDHEEDGASEAEGAAAEDGTEEPPELKKTFFVASSQGMEMWKSFAPLEALRELAADSADRATFGFDDANPITVDITAKRGATTLRIGGETYGSKDRYVESGGKLYLVDDATLRPLQFAASRLVERSLVPLVDSDVDKVEVELGPGKRVAWTQQNKDDSSKRFWAREDTPDKKDDVGSTWLDKVFKLKLRDYVTDSDAATAETVVAYTVYGKGETWRVEILKGTVDGKVAWYARSDFNRSVVSLTDSLARNVVDDLDELD